MNTHARNQRCSELPKPGSNGVVKISRKSANIVQKKKDVKSRVVRKFCKATRMLHMLLAQILRFIILFILQHRFVLKMRVLGTRVLNATRGRSLL